MEIELHHLQEMQISDDQSKRSISGLPKSVESASSSSKWNLSSDELLVTCLNHNSENKLKPIENYLNHFINTS